MTTQSTELPDHFNNTDDVLDLFADLNVRPHMQSTVIAADYDNEFFDEKNDNKTYTITQLDDDAIVSQWQTVSDAIKSGKVAPSTIHQIIELAVNAKSVEENTRLLQWVERPSTVTIGTQDLSTTRLMTGKMAAHIAKMNVPDDDYTKTFQGEGDDSDNEDEADKDIEVDSQEIIIKAAGYLCLCMMRLMKKDPEMFMKGVTSIKRGFSQFYERSSVTVMEFEFPRASIYAISDGLRSNTRLNQTMVYHVATGMSKMNRLSQSYHLMRFTFCQHVELMGLHAYKLFYELDNAFSNKLPTKVFLSWLTNDTTVKAVMMINEIVRKYDNENTSNQYLWLYARYLNNGYFYDLQTARCRFLVCVLAYLSDSQIKKKNESQAGAMELTELKKMSKADREAAIEYAKIFEEQYSKISATSHIMNRIQREVQKKKGLSTGASPTKRPRDTTEDMDAEATEATRMATEKRKKTNQGPSGNADVSGLWGSSNEDRNNVHSPQKKKQRSEEPPAEDDDEMSDDGAPPEI